MQRAPNPILVRHPIVFAGIPGGALVCGMAWLWCRGNVQRSRPLDLLGDASYSLHLTHIFVPSILRRPWRHLDPYLFSTQASFVTVCMVASVMVAIATFLWLARPMTKWLMGYAKR